MVITVPADEWIRYRLLTVQSEAGLCPSAITQQSRHMVLACRHHKTGNKFKKSSCRRLDPLVFSLGVSRHLS